MEYNEIVAGWQIVIIFQFVRGVKHVDVWIIFEGFQVVVRMPLGIIAFSGQLNIRLERLRDQMVHLFVFGAVLHRDLPIWIDILVRQEIGWQERPSLEKLKLESTDLDFELDLNAF